MLSKEEINKKKGAQQLDLVDTVVKQEKIGKKRLTVFLSLILTVGLSLGFYFYHLFLINSFSLKFPDLNFHLSLPSLPQLDPVNPLLSSDPNSWHICLFDLATSSLIFSKNCHLTALPSKLPAQVVSLLKSLPNGLDIKESLLPTSSSLDFTASIFSPTHRFLLAINVSGSSPLADSQKLIPQVAEALYWRYSKL